MRESQEQTKPERPQWSRDDDLSGLASTTAGEHSLNMLGTEEIVDLEARDELERLRAHFGISKGTPPPRVIGGRYQIEHVIARGGMGVVYLATDTKLHREVALKLIVSRPFASPERLRERLRQEAQALARVEHAKVVPIYDVGTHRGELYLAMRYIEGTTLRVWQQVEGRSARELVSIYIQAGRGLAAAHGAGLVHRDFKPDNVLVDEHGVAYVGDFGVAATLAATRTRTGQDDATDTATDTAQAAASRLTRSGQLLGTLPYMSKEQLLDRDVDARSDQFGFCVALWEACAGELPFDAVTAKQMLVSIERGPKAREKLPKWLVRVLAQGLSPDVDQRFSDMNSVIAALERGLGRPRRFAGITGAGLITVLLVLPWMRDSDSELPPPPSCESFSTSVNEYWTPSLRDQLAARAANNLPLANYAAATLDALALDWTDHAETLCTDGHAPPSTDPNRVCMEAWLLPFERRVMFFAENEDPMAIARAPELLLQMVATDANYCVVARGPTVDREVWESAELARGYSQIGDFGDAGRHAQTAQSRAEELAEGKFSAELAAAEFVSAEILARSREPSFGGRFFSAQAHALASGHDQLQLEILLLWTKSTALRLDLASLEEAKRYLGLVEPFLYRAHAPESGLQFAEYLEARGTVARAHGIVHSSKLHHRQAIEHHRAAAEIFTANHHPDLAAKALNNIGANLQNLEELTDAEAVYVEALDMLIAADLPPSYPTLVDTRLNYANVFIEQGSEGPSSDRVLTELAAVIKHAAPADRLRGLQFRCQLAIDSEDFDVGVPFARQALAELDARPAESAHFTAKLTAMAAFVLASAGEDEAWELLVASIAQIREHDEVEWLLFETWNTELLERWNRCEEAALLTNKVRSFASTYDFFEPWLSERPGHACARPRSPLNPNE